MKSFESRNAVALRKRVKKVHAKARFVGVLYLLGTLAIAVLACLPMLNINGEDLWVTTFMSPILALFSKNDKPDLLAGITSILYLIIFLSCIINFFKCFGKLGWLSKRSARYVNGYNRNMRAMERMGLYFSRAFSTMINGYLLIYLLQPESANVTLIQDMYFYAALGVGLVIHFIAGLIGGTVSFFNVGGPNSDVEEEPRNIGLFIYFFRNLIQVVATAAIIYFFTPTSGIGAFVNTLLAGADFSTLDIMKDVVPVALQVLTLIWIFVLVRHATNITEYNRFGIDGAGMKNYRLFSFFTVLTSLGLFALSYMELGAIVGNAKSYLTIAGIAFLAFLVDCICKTKREDDREIVDEEEEEYFAPKKKAQGRPDAAKPAAYPHPQMGPMPYPQAPGQPIYVPVYYPVPMPQAAPAPRHCAPGPMPCMAPPCAPMPSAPPCMPAPCAQMAPMPQRPFGLPPAMPSPAPCAASAPCAMIPPAASAPAPAKANAPVTAPTAAPSAPVSPSLPISAPTPAPAPVAANSMARPEPAPAPAHLQAAARPVATDQPKTKKELRQEKKEEKARAKFLKQSEKSAKKAKRLEKKVAKAEKKQAKKEQKLLKKAKKLPVAPVETPITAAPVVDNVPQRPTDMPIPEGIPFDTDPRELDMPIDPKKQFKVRCPRCGKELLVRETSPYHRCPSCDKVFSLRKFETYVKKS